MESHSHFKLVSEWLSHCGGIDSLTQKKIGAQEIAACST